MSSAKAAQSPKTTLPALAEMVDELGVLQKEYDVAMAPLEMKQPRIKALKEAIQAACTAPADKEWKAEGTRFGVRLGPCARERSINYGKLVKKIGAAVFAKFATCTLKALEENVAAATVTEVVIAQNTGPRKLSTFEKGIHLVAPTR